MHESTDHRKQTQELLKRISPEARNKTAERYGYTAVSSAFFRRALTAASEAFRALDRFDSALQSIRVRSARSESIGFYYEFCEAKAWASWPDETQQQERYTAERGRVSQSRISELHQAILARKDDAPMDTFQHRRDLARLQGKPMDADAVYYGLVPGNGDAKPEPNTPSREAAEQSKAWMLIELCEALGLPLSDTALKALQKVLRKHKPKTAKGTLYRDAVVIMHEKDAECSIPLRKSKHKGKQQYTTKPDWNIEEQVARLREKWMGHGPDEDADVDALQVNEGQPSAITRGIPFRVVKRKAQSPTPGVKEKASEARYKLRKDKKQEPEAVKTVYRRRKATKHGRRYWSGDPIIADSAWRDEYSIYGTGNREAYLRAKHGIYGIISKPQISLTWLTQLVVLDKKQPDIRLRPPAVILKERYLNRIRPITGISFEAVHLPMREKNVYDFARQCAQSCHFDPELVADFNGYKFLKLENLPYPPSPRWAEIFQQWISTSQHVCKEKDPWWDFDPNSHRAVGSDLVVDRLSSEQTSVVLTHRSYQAKLELERRAVEEHRQQFINDCCTAREMFFAVHADYPIETPPPITHVQPLMVTRGLCRLDESGIDRKQWDCALAEWETKKAVKGRFVSREEERRTARSEHPLVRAGAVEPPQGPGRLERTYGMDLDNERRMVLDTLEHPWEYKSVETRLMEIGVVKEPQTEPRFKPSQRADNTIRWLVSLSPM